ncbi:intestinal mucin-like protein [Synchiropus picturatus]
MICSDVCVIQNKTESCWTTTSPPTTPSVPTCPEWEVAQNETFFLCNCTMARCIENNIIEIIPYECPPLNEITCANGDEPVLVYDEYHCCEYFTCNCDCKGWGDSHHITFDGHYYSYQGNCTYILMEEILPKYNLKIYIDNVFCDPFEEVPCPRSIIVSYGSEVVTLKNHNVMGVAVLEAVKDGDNLKLPYSNHGVKISNTGLALRFEIEKLEVIVDVEISRFSVNLPAKYFGGNTQGQCGTCNNNQADDCMLPGGQLVQDCAAMAGHWLVRDIYQPNCIVPYMVPSKLLLSPSPTPCRPNSMCDLLWSSVFAECHSFVNPNNFYQGCVFDSCHGSDQAIECMSLQMYASVCAQAGVCLRWRDYSPLCEVECPQGKVYNPCGPAEPATCEDGLNERAMIYKTEGCFCPDGMKLFSKDSGICVDKCGCLDPDGVPREFHETFEYKCQTCTCEESTKTVTCKQKVCPPPPKANCVDPGFILVKRIDPENPCCSAYVCQCHSSTCPSTSMNCPMGYYPVVYYPDGKCCPKHICEPKKVCIHRTTEYQPGDLVQVNHCQKCNCSDEVEPGSGLHEIRCEHLKCNETCEQGFKYVKTDLDECCGTCVQTHCVLHHDGHKRVLQLGESWSSHERNCEYYTCVKSGEKYEAVRSNIVCPPFQESNCQPDTIQTASNGCCTICVEREKACKKVIRKMRITQNRCQSAHEVDIPYCEGSCNTFTRYSEVESVIQRSCSCCRETLSRNHTIELFCENGDVVPYTYIHVEECLCSPTDCSRPAPASRKRRSFTRV